MLCYIFKQHITITRFQNSALLEFWLKYCFKTCHQPTHYTLSQFVNCN